jgi:hypothetical protein
MGHILRKNCLLKHVIEGKIEERVEVTGRRGSVCKHLLHDLKKKKGYLKFKEEALDRALQRTHFGESCGSFVRQLKERMIDRSFDIFICHGRHIV